MTALAPARGGCRDAAARAHRWAHGESETEVERRQVGHHASARHARHERILYRARPPVGLLKALDAALHVEAPRGEASTEHQALHRNENLRSPACAGALRRGLPDAVPISVLALPL